ncbi:Acetate/butyrate--CoA ligase AAE7, peroxisomal [Leucoagaricus sp. SymC.cos]|nr:Acetate/butyrate--CoA ligase AAE7, peroxisomal [Leucoagaricus sp. SymC.cos]
MSMSLDFTLTPASIPPAHVDYRLKQPVNPPVNSHPLNPLDWMLRAAQIYPDKVALVHPNAEYPRQYTFAQWAQRIQNFAYALIMRGIKPGDRVAVIAPNSSLIADAHFGVIAARAILNPINYRLKPSEVAYILEHSATSLVLVDHEFTHLIPQGITVPVIVSKDTGRADDPYEAFLTDGRRFSQERSWGGLDAEQDERASAALCYTSGTTGKPKGVVFALRGAYLGAMANAFDGGMNRDSTYLWILPMFHAAGWTYPWASVFACAKQIILRTVDYTQIWHHFLHSGVTHYCGAPTVQISIINHPHARRAPQQITSLVGGAAPTASLVAGLEKLGIKPAQVYGQT